MFTKEQIDEIDSALQTRKHVRKMEKRAKKLQKRSEKAQRRKLEFRPSVESEE